MISNHSFWSQIAVHEDSPQYTTQGAGVWGASQWRQNLTGDGRDPSTDLNFFRLSLIDRSWRRRWKQRLQTDRQARKHRWLGQTGEWKQVIRRTARVGKTGDQKSSAHVRWKQILSNNALYTCNISKKKYQLNTN